ncbi:RNA polymerase subunit sigma [Bifidobacterium pseudolongum subsp. pseudolongum]|uniref:sigma factor-like helix-turn-helix DNA-binding protein n=1 Tax=Bifidobacterium pseudolongum TaxID=1694 RepID=UPI000CB2C8F3|nr:sigma factor-like helix-turn-helix DNA-binding protein [Bifidobacterium pseudolongum]PKV00278.1 RNA polymerase subunit sigma [Bifidobacterium pseudolongum subsp. pseudolongum]
MANANGKDHGSHDVGKGSGREHEASSWDEWSEQESEDFTDVATLRVLEDLEAVAEWMLTCGYGTFRPFHVPFADDAPDGIGQAIRRLNAFTFRDFCPDALPMDQVMAQLDADGFEDSPSGDVEPGTLSEAVMVVADSLLDRDRDVFERRLGVEEPDTLRAIGADWNISGERVRQIEHDLRARLAGAFERFHVEEKLKDLAPEGVPYMPLDMMGERMPELLETVTGLDVPLHVVIDNYYGKGFSMQIADGWVGMPNLKSARNWWRAVLQRRATPYGAVPVGLMDRYDLKDKDGQPTGAVRRWSRHCGVREYQGHYLTHSDPSRMAVAILSIEGHPMSIEELAASIQVGGDINDLETNLRLQPGLVRVNAQDWALKEWISQPTCQGTTDSPEKPDAPAGMADARTVGHGKTPRDTAASRPDGNQPDDPVLRAIVEAGVKYRDMRDRHGSLWLFGGPELQPLTDRLKRMGARFHYKPDGGRTTQGSPGWWSNDHWENGR